MGCSYRSIVRFNRPVCRGLVTESPIPGVWFKSSADLGSEGGRLAWVGWVGSSTASSHIEWRIHLYSNVAACRVVQGAVIPYREDCGVIGASIITVGYVTATIRCPVV